MTTIRISSLRQTLNWLTRGKGGGEGGRRGREGREGGGGCAHARFQSCDINSIPLLCTALISRLRTTKISASDRLLTSLINYMVSYDGQERRRNPWAHVSSH